jgi:hypothetical protein
VEADGVPALSSSVSGLSESALALGPVTYVNAMDWEDDRLADGIGSEIFE